MARYTTTEIGAWTFLVFADGMVKADDVVCILFDDARASIYTKDKMVKDFKLLADVPPGSPSRGQ